MNIFPYSNFHELNLDWVIDELKKTNGNLVDFIKINTIKYADPLQWDITKQYEANTVVVDKSSGYAYLSSRPVPTGVSLDRDDYWLPVFNVYAIYEDIKTGVAYNNLDSDTSLYDLPKGSLTWVADKMRQATKDITKGDRFTDSNSREINVSDVILEIINNVSTLAEKQKTDKAEINNNVSTLAEKQKTDKAETDKSIGAVNTRVDNTNNALGELSDRVDKLSKSVDSLNVIAFGAKGDGVTDDYEAFRDCYNAASRGDTITVPAGIYYLSKNPYPVSDNVSSVSPDIGKTVRWDIANGVYFRGPGVGDVSVGRGTFDSPFLTNPWLTVSGATQVVDLNALPDNDRGALLGDSKELVPIDTEHSTTGNNWHCLEYRGACTGRTDNTKCNVELLNQVLNITGCKGIATEIDVNNYTNPEGFSTGLFLTGGGKGLGDMTAVDITRDEDSTKWVCGVSAHMCKTGFWVDSGNCDVGFMFGDVVRKERPGLAIQQSYNGADGIVLRRKTDDNPTGNLIVAWNAAENKELFALGANGDIRTATPIVECREYTKSGSFTPGEQVININTLTGKRPIMVSEIAPDGFAAPVWYVSKTDTTVTVYVNGEGSGKIHISVLYA